MIPASCRGRRVLVTGGAGFIGSNLVPRLLERGASVRVVDNLERGKRDYLAGVLGAIELLEEDLRDRSVCRKVTRGVDTVFHLAAKVGGIGYYLERAGEVLAENTLMDTLVLDAARVNEVERFVYASSAHVYPIERQKAAGAPALREEEALPARPELSYGWAKLLAERQIEYLSQEARGPRAAILRLVGAYGENQDLDLATGSAIPVFIRRAILYPKDAPFVMWGTGKETRSYCYVGDVVDGLLRAAEKLDQRRLVGPLNLGAEGRVTIEELARKIVEISGKTIPIVKDAEKPTVIWGQAVDCSRAREMLDDWRPRVTLPEGLKRTFTHIEHRLSRSPQ